MIGLRDRFDAAIFDMDGLLIDSEPLWQQAEMTCFRPLGVPVTPDLCRASAGRRIDEVVRLWHGQFGWTGPGIDEMVERVLAEVTRLIARQGQALPGAVEVLVRMRKLGMKVAIASSSPMTLIEAVVDSLELGNTLDVLHSGVDEPAGKPDPAVFLTTARRLDVCPSRCLVFEDAPAGVAAAVSSGMAVVAVPSVFKLDDPGFKPAWLVLSSLEDFNQQAAIDLLEFSRRKAS